MTASPFAGARDAFVRRLTDATNGAFDVAAAYLGLRLGLYASLSADGPGTAAELAVRTGTNERYVREWLEQQTTTGVLTAEQTADSWRFTLPPEHGSVLLDAKVLDGFGATVLGQLESMAVVPQLIDAYRSGRGVRYADYGSGMSEAQAASTRPVYETELAAWIEAVPDLAARLRTRSDIGSASGPARILDVGCGFGWSSVTAARTFPGIEVDGIDLDETSIAGARALAVEHGLADRVRFEVRDAVTLAGAGYDAAFMFEMLHDLAHPTETLRAARGALGPRGVVLVADEITGQAFDGRINETDRRHYGWSLIHCLPASMIEPDSAATGTVIRPSTVRAYAEAAGFSSVEVLPVESIAFRLYLLRP